MVKTFFFQVSTWCGMKGNTKKDGRETITDELYDNDSIDAAINKFAACHNILDIKVTHIDNNYHNNGGDNSIILVYTILYK